MKQKWNAPEMSVLPVDLSKIGDVTQMSDSEFKIRLEEVGYKFRKTYQASENYIYRKIADSDVLISVGSNIANFNGYIEMNKSAVTLWEKLQRPCGLDELEQTLEEKYGINHERAVEDVLDFLKELQEHNMVVVN
ncbi:MAG: PqqD family protein [Lachnospiraceae bacterium]